LSHDRRAQVAVIGGGISGLTTAHYLTGMGIDTRVIEKSDRTGGTIESQRIEGYLVDYGPNSGLDTTPLLGEMFHRLGTSSSLQYASDKAKNRYIVRNGRLHALPMGPGAFVKTPLFSPRAKLALLREPFIRPSDPKQEESLAEFVRRRLGREFLDYAINPFVSGIYAGVPEKLSVRESFPKLYDLEQQYGSLIKGTIKGMRERRRRRKSGEQSRASARMFSFAGGMQTIVDALSRELADRVHTGTIPLCVEKKDAGFAVHSRSADGDWALGCDAVVLAIPAYAYREIDFTMGLEVGEHLDRISYPPVSVVFFGYKANPATVPLDGFGFLIPEKEKRGVLGTIWNSTLFPERAPAGGVSLTTFVGGSRQPDNALLDEGAIVDLVRADLNDLLGITTKPDLVAIRCWERAIPQYNIGHTDIIRAIAAFENKTPGLYISGNFRGGVAISDCVGRAREVCDRVASQLGGPASG
jgi:oxygen-dependent protoporphyrinogen oxidase